MNDMGGTLPLIEKSCSLQDTKNCATFGLIDHISTQIM